jgi:hypothetical protein
VSFLERIAAWLSAVPSARDPGPNAHTPKLEAQRIAAEWAERNQKLMSSPLNATFKVVRGRPVWEVESNYLGKGHRIIVTVDDATGTVVGHDEVLTR